MKIINFIIMKDLIKICEDLYKFPRSLTGQGTLDTIQYLKKIVPFEIKSFNSGDIAYDWTVPPEWNIKSAYIIDLKTGEKIIDFSNNTLHVVGYSLPVNSVLNFSELEKNLHYLKDKPNAIPYKTSYFEKNWGFCISYNEFKKINRESTFNVVINSKFDKKGKMNYGEFYVPGQTNREIFFSSYICHPQMLNNELSGPVVLTAIANEISKKKNYYSYRFVLIPETIGSIFYINKNLKKMKSNIVGGYNISCVGDEKNWGYIPSRDGNTLSDFALMYVLNKKKLNYKKYSWLDRGSDERQYCSPGVDLPIASLTRSKYGEYPEYHTSLDNFELVTNKGLNQSKEVYLEILDLIETNKSKRPKAKFFCEPNLGKRKLYSKNSEKDYSDQTRDILNFLSYSDGKKTILEICFLSKIEFNKGIELAQYLYKKKLIDLN